jgi:DNA-binding NarL/FixJ family response regulator
MELRLVVVEPESLRRRLVAEVVARTAGVRLVNVLASPGELPPAPQVDILLVSSVLVQREPAGLEKASLCHPEAYFVLYAASPNLEALLAAPPIPVRGILSFNHLSAEEFSRDLAIIAQGGAIIEPLTAQQLLQHLRQTALPRASGAQAGSELSNRERQVLDLVRRGLSNKEIALRLGISLGTVRAHLRNVFHKLDVSSRAGAAAVGQIAGQKTSVAV